MFTQETDLIWFPYISPEVFFPLFNWNTVFTDFWFVFVFYSLSALGGPSALHIPAFPSGGCLIDYVPQVCQLLTNKVSVPGVT